tara:strand:+ start:25397 stop:25990 length:594 start_codon:yes stop_codon:yes gene_type:complete
MDNEKTLQNYESNSIYYPPGGILVWLLIILEIFTFLGASLVFMYYRGIEWDDFLAFRMHINPVVGTINTVILITSGYFMANSLHQLRSGENGKAAQQILIGLLFGVLFLVVKGAEYYFKIEAGIGLGSNTFFTFYWLMTGFHFIHVLFGVGLLTYMYQGVKSNKYDAKNMFDVESSATYWHMCDLIWILIFPVLYLI